MVETVSGEDDPRVCWNSTDLCESFERSTGQIGYWKRPRDGVCKSQMQAEIEEAMARALDGDSNSLRCFECSMANCYGLAL